MRSRRVGLLALAAVGASALLVAPAAGVARPDAGARQQKTVIRMLVGQPETAALESAARKQIEEFERRNPDIDVKREAIDNDQLRTIIKTRLASGQGPDVFGYDTGPGFGGVLAKAKLVLPLTEAYRKYKWNIYPWARQRATYGGVVYGVPDQVEEVGIFYNRDLFKKYSLGPPRTLARLQAISEKFKKEGIIPLAFANKDRWPAGHQFSMLVSNLLGRKGLDNILYANGKWNQPKVVKAIDIFFRQFQKAGYFPKSPNAVDYDDGNRLFFAGRAAMLPTGTWLVSQITETARFRAGFFPFPSIDGSGIAPPAGVGGGLFVSARTKNRQAAFRLLNFFVKSPYVHRTSLEVFNTIPAHPVNVGKAKVSPLFKQVLRNLWKSTEGGAFGYNIDVLTPARFNEVMFAGFQDVLNGRRTPKQQADALQRAWAKAKAAGETLKKP